jgi:hypothetical protein
MMLPTEKWLTISSYGKVKLEAKNSMPEKYLNKLVCLFVFQNYITNMINETKNLINFNSELRFTFHLI